MTEPPPGPFDPPNWPPPSYDMGSPPPPRPRPRVKSGRTWVGIGAAFLANVVAIGLGLGIAAVSPSSTRGTVGFYAVAGLQLLALVGCIVAGVIFYTRRDRDFGTGLLIGGGLAMLIMPCVGFGVCVVAIGGNL